MDITLDAMELAQHREWQRDQAPQTAFDSLSNTDDRLILDYYSFEDDALSGHIDHSMTRKELDEELLRIIGQPFNVYAALRNVEQWLSAFDSDDCSELESALAVDLVLVYEMLSATVSYEDSCLVGMK